MAQAEAASGKPFCRYWILAGSLTVDGNKMSKSLGNFLTIKDALKLYTPEAIRYFVLSGHYRGPVDFSRDALDAAQRGVSRLHNTALKLTRRMKEIPPAGTALLAQVSGFDDYRVAFEEAMNEDFNTPQALAVLFDFTKEVNRYLDSNEEISAGTLSAMEKTFRDLAGKILGVLPEKPRAGMQEQETLEGLMRLILDLRQQYRAARDWSNADAIRSRLNELGISIEDGPTGTTWRLM